MKLDEAQQHFPTISSISEREIGVILTKLEYIKDELDRIEKEVKISIIERKDLAHSLNKVVEAIERIFPKIKMIEGRLKEVEDKFQLHLHNSINLSDEVANKVGKWLFRALWIAGGILILELFNVLVRPGISIFFSK